MLQVLSFITWIDVDWSNLAYPSGCLVNGFITRMLVVSFAPYAMVLFVFCLALVGGLIFSYLMRCRGGNEATRAVETAPEALATTSNRSPASSQESGSTPSVRNTMLSGIFMHRPGTGHLKTATQGTSWWMEKVFKLVPLALLVVFTFLPSVSRMIFSSW